LVKVELETPPLRISQHNRGLKLRFKIKEKHRIELLEED
jgi:hypothetical protein